MVYHPVSARNAMNEQQRIHNKSLAPMTENETNKKPVKRSLSSV